jgi:hypothetical protein
MKKKITAEKLAASAWAAALTTTIASDKVPPGWQTTRELSLLLGKSDTRVGEMLREALRAGKCERQMFRIPTAGTVRPVPHYRLL